MSDTNKSRLEIEDELPLEENFIEQAEYIDRVKFLKLATEHPNEVEILKKLMGGGAKLLIGPRGCGKSTLMKKAYYQLIEESSDRTLPVYVNFKLTLKLEPYYVNGPNASYWFRSWLIAKILFSIWETIEEHGNLSPPQSFPAKDVIVKAINSLEASSATGDQIDQFTSTFLSKQIEDLIAGNDLKRCVIFIDDAAHSFSEKQQEDFFDFFRAIKSRTISPKAAIYPGITSHSANFHVGHDAEQIEAWVKPTGEEYESFMLSLAEKRFDGAEIDFITGNEEGMRLLAYAAFGIPRAFLGMLRSIFNSPEAYINASGALNKSQLLRLSRAGREMSHAVYDSLTAKLPSYKSYVENGSRAYQAILTQIRGFNKGKPLEKQGLQFAVKIPIDADLEKVFGFLQYSGLIMSSDSILKGEKGAFQLYHVHIGDLTSENIIVGSRTKSVSSFLEVIRAPKHQAWPRLTSSSILEVAELAAEDFTLALPLCHTCSTPRSNPEARFCSNCGTQLKPSSAYEALVKQDISVLPISKRLEKRIKEHSHIRRVRDILTDVNREALLGVPYIGKARAQAIVGHAEEYVS
ncbi:hypothetical protein [Cobetia sp.]|uniref:hypothetical protein n=1 Tax=Cobetia sp. TaxID=1873876 RepID=UPI00257D2AA2|nr:hypothetical protein [Cobetia sp.]|tara:strand:- start:2516 stop:4246 length:1731 start_codon:yes stop_codon:yes gene_type:complete